MQDSVDRFLSVLVSERGFSGNTISAYRNDLAQFILYLQDPPAGDHQTAVGQWAELTDQHLGVYLLFLRERDYAPSTVARKTAAIKSFCHYLVDEGVTRADPSANMTSPKVDKYVPHAMSADEIARLLAEPTKGVEAGRPEALRDLAMLETLYSTGMRVTELVSLDLDDLDLEAGTVRASGKAGRRRSVPIRPSAVDATGHYLSVARPVIALAGERALFVNHRGGRLTRQGFWLILKAYAERAGIAQITPHTLRHSFATHAIRGGVELRDVQHRLGHVSISTTLVYRRMAGEPLVNEPVPVETVIEPEPVAESA